MVWTQVKTYQIICFKYVPFIVGQLYPNKPVYLFIYCKKSAGYAEGGHPPLGYSHLHKTYWHRKKTHWARLLTGVMQLTGKLWLTDVAKVPGQEGNWSGHSCLWTASSGQFISIWNVCNPGWVLKETEGILHSHGKRWDETRTMLMLTAMVIMLSITGWALTVSQSANCFMSVNPHSYPM